MDFRVRPTADEIKAALGLKRHPTCGFVAETYRSPLRIPKGALPDAYDADRPYASALYFLVTPDETKLRGNFAANNAYWNDTFKCANDGTLPAQPPKPAD